MQELSIDIWYQMIAKPDWAPPVWLFGVAWGIIYPLMILSFGYVFYKTLITKDWRPKHAVPFIINLVANLAYSIGTFAVFPGKYYASEVQPYYWPATILVLIVLVTLLYMIYIGWKHKKWVAFAQIPYLIWICIASALQVYITFNN